MHNYCVPSGRDIGSDETLVKNPSSRRDEIVVVRSSTDISSLRDVFAGVIFLLPIYRPYGT
jgi:hypothetical protein